MAEGDFDINQPGATILPGGLGGPASTGQTIKQVLPGPRAGTAPPAQQPQGSQGSDDISVEDLRKRLLIQAVMQGQQAQRAIAEQAELKKQLQQRAIAAGYAKDALNRQTANAPLPPTYDPQRKEVPTTPPRFSPRDPGIAIAQPLSVLAALGGLFARNAGTATIRAMTGAMEGLRESDWQKYEAATKEFDQKLKATLEYNRAEHEKYQEAWDNRKNTWAERVAKMQMLATSYGNTAMLNSLATGNAEMIQQQLDVTLKSLDAVDKFVKSGKAGAGHEGTAFQAQAAEELYQTRHAQDPNYTRAEAWRSTTGKLDVDDRKQLEGVKSANRLAEKEKDWDNRFEMARRRGESAENIEKMREQARLDLKHEEHKLKMEEIAAKTGPNGRDRFLNMGRVTAALTEMEFNRLSQLHPEWPEADRLREAMGTAESTKKGLSFNELEPGLQREIKQGWGGTDEANFLEHGIYKMNIRTQGRFQNSSRAMYDVNDVADYVRAKPRSVGALARLMTKFSIESLIRPTNDDKQLVEGSPEDVARVHEKLNEMDRRISDGFESIIGERLPDGSVVSFSDASDAVILAKKLRTLGLSDAASLSTNGQGGTVYLDRVFSDEIWNQNLSPGTMLRLLGERVNDSNKLWQEIGLDWHNRKDLDKKEANGRSKLEFFKGVYKDPQGVTQYSPRYAAGAMMNYYSNLHGQDLKDTINSDPGLTVQLRNAIMLADVMPTREAVDRWIEGINQQRIDNKIDDATYQSALEIGRLVKENKFGVP